MLKISNANLELSSTYSQMAEQYLANEVLPRLRNSTTGKAFFGRYFGPDDIISDALEHSIPILRNPNTWERENRELSDEEVKKIVDKIVAWSIRNPSYSKANWESTKGKQPPRELANIDFEDDPVGRLTEQDATLSTEPQGRFIQMEEDTEIQQAEQKLKQLLNQIEPAYGQILEYFIPNIDRGRKGVGKASERTWFEILQGADAILERDFTPTDARKMALIIRNSKIDHQLSYYLLDKLKQAERYAAGKNYRKRYYLDYEKDPLTNKRIYTPQTRSNQSRRLADVGWWKKIAR